MSRPIALAALLLFVPVLRADSLEKELEKLQGSWKVEVIEENGVREPMEEAARFTIAIRNTTMTVTMNGRDETTSFRIDPSANPKTIDLTPNYGADKGKVSLGIYEVMEDLIRIVARPRGERPKEFVSGNGILMMILRRAK